MDAIKGITHAPASRSAGVFTEKTAPIAQLARVLPRPCSDSRFWHYAPKEAAAKLAKAGISLSERTIQWRCTLPVGHPLRIATNPAFRGRLWIPETEIARLLGANAEAVA